MYHIGDALFYLLLIGSGVVWLCLLIRQWSGLPPLPLRERNEPEWNPFVVLVGLGWIAMQLQDQVHGWLKTNEPVQEPTLEPLQLVQLDCVFNIVVLVVMLSLLALSGHTRLRDAGVTADLWKQDVTVGGLGFLASLLPVFSVLWGTLPWRSAEKAHSFFKILQDQPGLESVVWVGLAAVVLAPLTEELVYRVVLQGWLQTHVSPGRAIAIASVVFAAVHGLPDSLALIPLALVLGYIYYRRHSFLAVVALHALFNAWNLAYFLLTDGTCSHQLRSVGFC